MGYGPEGKDWFPFTKKERQATQDYAKSERQQAILSDESNHIGGWQFDSRLQLSDRSFEVSFDDVVPPKQGPLRSYIERSLIKTGRAGKAIGIEYGGQGVLLFKGFTPGIFAKTAGIALTLKTGTPLNPAHTIITTDFTTSAGKQMISRWLNGEKVDVVFERLLGGLDYLPKDDPFEAATLIQDWYQQCGDGAIHRRHIDG